MNSVRNFGIPLVVLAPVALITGGLWEAVRAQEKRSANPFDRAEKLVRENKTMGTELIAVLENEDVPIDKRLKAGALLGQLQHLPAIPKLIRFAHLEPAFRSEAGPPPLYKALAEFGRSAVPAIVDECLKHDLFLISGGVKKNRSLLQFYIAIKRGKTFQTARIYARGIAATRGDRNTQHKVTAFLKQLAIYEK